MSRQASNSVPEAPSHPNCVPANAIHSTSRLLVAPPVLSEGTWRPANIPGQVAYSAMTSQYSQTEQDSADTKFPLQAFTWLPYHSALQHREASDEIPSQEGPEVTDNDFREGGDGALTMKRIRRSGLSHVLDWGKSRYCLCSPPCNICFSFAHLFCCEQKSESS